MRTLRPALLCGIVLVWGCAAADPASNTGFNGTWGRETASLDVSMYIWHDGERYRFRMLRESRDGTGRITCDWNGECREYLNGAPTSLLQFRLEETGDPGRLLLHCRGRVTRPAELEISYTHELTLSDDGLTLISHTVESQGIRYEGQARGRRTLAKRSDAVPEPPSPGDGRER